MWLTHFSLSTLHSAACCSTMQIPHALCISDASTLPPVCINHTLILVLDWMWRGANRTCHRTYHHVIEAPPMLSNWHPTAPQHGAYWSGGFHKRRPPHSRLLDQCLGKVWDPLTIAPVRASIHLWVRKRGRFLWCWVAQGSESFNWPESCDKR